MKRHQLLADRRVDGDGGLKILQVGSARMVNCSKERLPEFGLVAQKVC